MAIIAALQFLKTFVVVHLGTIYKNWSSIQDNQSTVSAG